MSRVELALKTLSTRTMACLVLWCGVSDAVSQTMLQGDSVRLIDNIEIQSKSKSISNPDLMQVMDSTDINAFGLRGVADVVKRFAGVAVRDYGGIGGMKTVGVRGTSASHTAVSYDGIVVSNTQAGQIDLSRFSTSGLQSVGITLGQGSGRLLSARHLASAAVVEINNSSVVPNGKYIRPWAEIMYGSFGHIQAGIGLRSSINKAVGINALLAYTRADGDYPFTLKNGKRTDSFHRDGSDVESIKAEATITTPINNGIVSTNINYYRSERGLPGGVILYVESAHERLWDEHWSVQSRCISKISSSLTMAIRAKYSHSWNKYEDTDVKYEGGKRTDIYHQSEYYGSVALEWQPLRWTRFTLAEDLSLATLSSNLEEQPDPLRLSSQTALRWEVEFDRLRLDAYALSTTMKDHARDSKTAKVTKYSLSQLAPQPSIGLSYRLLPNENLYLRARFKNTFRVPTFTDMYYLHIGNTNLKPERAHLWSGGVAWTHTFWKQTNISLAFDAYINNVDDKIVCFPTTYVWRMMNIGSARIKGLDLTADITSKLSERIKLHLNGAYTYQDARNKGHEVEALYNAVLPYSPHHQGNVSMSLSTLHFNLSYLVLFCSSRYSNSQNASEYKIDPYQEHSVTLSASYPIKKFKLSGSFSVINLADSQYEVVKYYPMPGRHYQATIKVEF